MVNNFGQTKQNEPAYNATDENGQAKPCIFGPDYQSAKDAAEAVNYSAKP